jgi:2,4-dienoyl-CoA reductase-like NADH-dependent reductase (Old Yellow Enzyme family)
MAADVLGQPLHIGRMRMPNRIVRSGTTERAVDAEGLPTPAMHQLHRALAAGGAGLVITGYLAVADAVRASASHGILRPGPAADAWAKIVAESQEAGDARLCAQLGHGGVLSLAGYAEDEIVRLFRESACAAAEAGFDAVQLHAAHGYLLGQLLAEAPPLRSRPTAHHGLELVLRIVDEVCRAVRPDLAVLLKANVSDFVPGGYAPPDAAVFADAVAGTALDGIEWSGWSPVADSWYTPSRLGEVEPRSEGFFVPFAARAKARNPHLVTGSCGGFRSAQGMSRAIVGYGLDFVSLSRPLVVEPDLPRRLLEGASRGRCDGCNQCLAKPVRPVHCPRLRHEPALEPPPTREEKQV